MPMYGKKYHDFITKKIGDYLAEVRPERGGWHGTLEHLKSMIFDVREEDERTIEIKVKYFEQSVNDLKRRFASTLSRFQQIQIEIWLGHNYEKYGVWEKALKAYGNAYALCDVDKDAVFKAETICAMGDIYMKRSQWKKASDAFQESLTLNERVGDDGGVAVACISMGILNFEKGRLETAAKHWGRGLELAERIDDKRHAAQIYNNLGALKSTQGLWREALGYYAKSSVYFEALGDYRGLAETYHNMGMTYADVARWNDAGTYYEKSHNIAKEIGDVRLQAMVKLNRVELYTQINDIYVGLALCNQALRAFIELQDHLGEAECYKFMGVLYAKAKEWDLADSFFEDSIHLAQKYKNPLLEAESLTAWGKVRHDIADFVMAEELYQKALPLFQHVGAQNDVKRVNALLDEVTQALESSDS